MKEKNETLQLLIDIDPIHKNRYNYLKIYRCVAIATKYFSFFIRDMLLNTFPVRITTTKY